MRLLTIFAFLSSLFCFQASLCDQAAAQHFRKSGDVPVIRYQPNDPWARGKVFNIQTGNSGFFYNCDGEQAKRNSPYICWKPDDEPMFPPLFAPWKSWRNQIGEVRQRVQDGSCCSLGCSCHDCKQASQNGLPSDCATCVQTAANQPRLSESSTMQSASAKVKAVDPMAIESGHGLKYGLVQRQLQESAPTRQSETPASRSVKQSSVAAKSLLEQLRGTRRR